MEEELIVGGVSNEQPYDKIDILNASLTELSNDVHGIPSKPVVNEIDMPSVSSLEVENDLINNEEIKEETTVVDEEQAALVKEITSNEEDATNEPSSKGQIILIGILSFVLIVLLVAMVIFTNAL